jgi:hypothetical protein
MSVSQAVLQDDIPHLPALIGLRLAPIPLQVDLFFHTGHPKDGAEQVVVRWSGSTSITARFQFVAGPFLIARLLM